MTRARRSRTLDMTREKRLDLYDYAHSRTRRPRRRARHDAVAWTVTDDWPEEFRSRRPRSRYSKLGSATCSTRCSRRATEGEDHHDREIGRASCRERG